MNKNEGGILKVEEKLKKIIENSYKKENFEKALTAISACAHYYYEYNQKLFDDYLETVLENIGEVKYRKFVKWYEGDQETILFYDGFGLDTRGLALIYLRGLACMERKIIYVTTENAIDKQPEISKITSTGNFVREYISTKRGYSSQICSLIELFNKYKPSVAFLYTYPYDVAGVLVFNLLKNVKKYQINLTDHAFWIGINAFDYCIEFRDYGYTVSKKYRKIDERKLIKLPFYPYINYDVKFQGFPFQTMGYKVVFSGGALYKTISEDNYFYKIVNHILEKCEDVIFVYAGSGNSKKIDDLAAKYSDRIYHIKERTDLYQVMQNIYFYLNTYPFLGGLMTQYAVAAGKLPITLRHGAEQEGLLLNQEETGSFFDTIDELLFEVDKILNDSHYLMMKEKKLKELNCLISPEQFCSELKQVISNNSTSFCLKNIDVDISMLQKEYRYRMNEDTILKVIARIRNKSLFMDFKFLFVKRFFQDKVIRKLRERKIISMKNRTNCSLKY